jgi:hypothetical protein
MKSGPKYPRIYVRIREEGSPAATIGRVAIAMGHHSVPQEEVDAFCAAARADDYERWLIVTQQWVEVL